MKKELIFEELTLDEKLGLVMCANLTAEPTDEGIERILNMIREHRLGAVWVSRGAPDRNEILKKMKDLIILRKPFLKELEQNKQNIQTQMKDNILDTQV